MDIRGLIRQVAGFSAVGTSAFLVDYLILMLLTQTLGMEPVVASTVSFVVATAYNYAMSMRFVFSHRGDMGRKKEFLIFLALSAIGLVMNDAIIYVGTEAFGTGAIDVSVTKLAAGLIVSVWNFLSRRRWLDADGAERRRARKARRTRHL